jgi:hypothetical protein
LIWLRLNLSSHCGRLGPCLAGKTITIDPP